MPPASRDMRAHNVYAVIPDVLGFIGIVRLIEMNSSEVRLQLTIPAYNLENVWWRRLVLPKRIDHWSLTSLQERLGKTGGCFAKNAQ